MNPRDDSATMAKPTVRKAAPLISSFLPRIGPELAAIDRVIDTSHDMLVMVRTNPLNTYMGPKKL